MNRNEKLIDASSNGHTETVKVLLEHGADVHADNDGGLRSASYNGHTETVKVLLEHGADVHARDDYSLRLASDNGHTETVKLFLIEYDMKVKQETLDWLKENNCDETINIINKRDFNKSLAEKLRFNIDDKQKQSLPKKMKQQGLKI